MNNLAYYTEKPIADNVDFNDQVAITMDTSSDSDSQSTIKTRFE